MALSNLSLEPSAAKKGPDCTVCQALAELPSDKADLILGALRNPRWRYTEIVNEVASDQDVPEWVRNIAEGTYSRHAKGGCFLMRQRGEKLR